jgi:hypothetical protein
MHPEAFRCDCKNLNFAMHVQARKALRALKSLVKLQALVRGYLVRKQAATTLRRLQALMRLQAKTASSRKSVEQVRILILRDGLAQVSFIFPGMNVMKF